MKRFASTLKVAGIVVLVLLLQIPLLMISGLLQERLARRNSAVAEITQSWGRAQTILGPILVVPYRVPATIEKDTLVNGHNIHTTEQKSRDAFAYFLPDELTVDGSVEPASRHRGIYEAIVYTSRLKLSGRFSSLDASGLDIPAEALRWDRAWVALSVSDLRGTGDVVQINWNEKSLPLAPGTRIGNLNTGLHLNLTDLSAASGAQVFSLELSFNGSESLSFVPAGMKTVVHLRSPWSDPGFNGALLPAERDVTPAGFTATWQASYYAHEYAQKWTDRGELPSVDPQTFARSSFGVSLVKTVDSYRSVERATKYGALFITLLFTTFFLFEVLAALRLHAIHYLLVGAALCLFYLGLLSLSEFIAFPAAYACAACASTLMIGFYCRSILKSAGRSLAITGALAGTYGYLFFVLQMQDYALLAGTVALFLVLAAVMFATRKVDWTRDPATA